MKDLFSQDSGNYAQYRPLYPAELYEHIYHYTSGFKKCWDCATGNGQVAHILSDSFEEVYATDISNSQLEETRKKENINYLVSPAENTPFDDNSFDLITVGQALHWFDFDAFNMEARRVLKPNGIIAEFGYGLNSINQKIDPVIKYLYSEILFDYWEPERKHIDQEYKSIPFPFHVLENDIIVNRTLFSLEEYIGYLNTWSSVKSYITQHRNNPIDLIRNDLSRLWTDQKIEIKFPVFIRIGKNIPG